MAWTNVDFDAPTEGVSNITKSNLDDLQDNETDMLRVSSVWAIHWQDDAETDTEVLSQVAQTNLTKVSRGRDPDGEADGAKTWYPAYDPTYRADQMYGSSDFDHETGAGKTFEDSGATIGTNPIVGTTGVYRVWDLKDNERWWNFTTADHDYYGGCGDPADATGGMQNDLAFVYAVRVDTAGTNKRSELIKIRRSTGAITVIWAGGDTETDYNGQDFLARDVCRVGSVAYVTDGSVANGRVAEISLLSASYGTLNATHTNINQSTETYISGIAYDGTNVWISYVENGGATTAPTVGRYTSNDLTWATGKQATYNITLAGTSDSEDWDGIVALENQDSHDTWTGVTMWALVFRDADGNFPSDAPYEVVGFSADSGDYGTVRATLGPPWYINTIKGIANQNDNLHWVLGKEGTNDHWLIASDYSQTNVIQATGATPSGSVDSSPGIGCVPRPYVSSASDTATGVGCRYIGVLDTGEYSYPTGAPHRFPKGDLPLVSTYVQGDLDAAAGHV